MKRVILVLGLIPATMICSKAAIHVKGKGGIVLEGDKKVVCPTPSPYVCAVIDNLSNPEATTLNVGDHIRIRTTTGETSAGTIIKLEGTPENEGYLIFK